jgi:hypothetical protein
MSSTLGGKNSPQGRSTAYCSGVTIRYDGRGRDFTNLFDKENPLKLREHSKALVLALGLALAAAACQSSQNAPPRANTQPSAAPAMAPLPAKALPPVPWPPAVGGEVWRSETTGKEYRIKVDGDKLYAEWVNPSSVAAEYHSYIHTECVRKGSKWVGASEIFLPCTVGRGPQEHIANTCNLKVKFEIDSMSKSLITGHTMGLKPGGFDCQTCKVLAAAWAGFKWVPAKGKGEAKPAAAKKD